MLIVILFISLVIFILEITMHYYKFKIYHFCIKKKSPPFFFSGIAMLLFALFMSARMGIFQETIYSRFGKHPSEALFYNVSIYT